jgi:DNA invertase Pin-like site-specific DNA recombinase
VSGEIALPKTGPPPIDPITTVRAAIYIRVSKRDQRTGGQEHDTHELVVKRGWQLGTRDGDPAAPTIYSDVYTGTRREKRPGLDALMADAKAGRFDVVVVWRRDRLFRSLREHVTIVAEFRDLKIDLVSVTEPHVDTTTAAGKAMLNVAAVFAELEADIVAERTKMGVAEARRQGKRLGRPPRVDADQVRALRADGLTYTEIAKRLGLPAFKSDGTIRRALLRPTRPPRKP